MQLNRDFDLLCPIVATRGLEAIRRANRDGYPIRMFEGWRHPKRQTELYAQSRTAPGPWVTDSRAWESWHQYACAMDIVFYLNNEWVWEKKAAYDKIAPYFVEQGFEWLNRKEMAHFQITGGLTVTEARAINFAEGLPGLWIKIQEKVKTT